MTPPGSQLRKCNLLFNKQLKLFSPILNQKAICSLHQWHCLEDPFNQDNWMMRDVLRKIILLSYNSYVLMMESSILLLHSLFVLENWKLWKKSKCLEIHIWQMIFTSKIDAHKLFVPSFSFLTIQNLKGFKLSSKRKKTCVQFHSLFLKGVLNVLQRHYMTNI